MGMIFGGYDEPAWGAGSNCSWSTSCRSDRRFNMSGYASSIWTAMEEVDKAILAKAKELGIEPPSDIEYSGCKS